MKKVGFIVLAVILALGLVGAAYAAFSQNLFAQANVQTGNVSVEWSSNTTAVTGNNAGVTAGGDSLSAAVVYGATNATDDTATITVSNAYPGAWVEITPALYNAGTIPVTVNIAAVSSYALYTGDLFINGGLPAAVNIAPGATVSMAPFYVEVAPSSQANGTTLYAQFTLNAVSP
jgi:hypothetical protein